MIDIDEPLNAFKEFPGPILLLAGPGTGKTFQLAQRVKFLVETMNADPDEIAVMTFTNEAARNMRERLGQDDINIPPEKTPQTILTMHSISNAIIGVDPLPFGLPAEYGVLTEDHPQSILLKDAAFLAGYERKKGDLAGICRRKGSCQENTDIEKCQICHQYRMLLRKCSLLDYDDQIFLACWSLKKNPDLKAQWQAKARYLLVDEYQDINQAQCELIQLLTGGQEDGLFAVGDDDQSIYSFRGGSPEYIRNFEKCFGSSAKIGRLSKSWRCPVYIYKGARSMVTTFYKDSVSKPEPMFSEKAKSETKIVFYDVPTEQWEANIIAKLVKEKVRAGSVTIIIPNSLYFPPIRAALKRRGIPYNYKAKIDESGISRIILLAEWVENQDDNLRLRQLLDLIIENHDELTKMLPANNASLTIKREMASQEVAKLWNHVNADASLWLVLCKKAEDNTFFASLKNDCLDEIISLLDDATSGSRKSLPRFMEKSALFVAPGRNPRGLISEIREWRAERIGATISASYSPVSVYNRPSAKGLEADFVFVVGVSEGIIPSRNGDVEEESRLFYVAMTRAKKELYLFSARKRPAKMTFLPASFQLNKSRFIDAIPKENIEIHYLKRR